MRTIDQPLSTVARLVLIAAAVLMLAVYTQPLWNLTMFAPQYPHGLRLDIYEYGMVGGNSGQDIKEINLLNHYIGMRDLATDDFTEFLWMPFALGAIALLLLRAAAFGTLKELVDATVVFGYVCGFALWSFGYRMYRYGHDLAPGAPVKVDPFTPPVFGHQKIANFDVYSYPQTGAYLLTALALLLVAMVVRTWWQQSRARAA